MYERFTDRARKVMQLANQEAQRDDRGFVDTEHVLLGLAREGSGVAANVLKNLGATADGIAAEVGKVSPLSAKLVNGGKLPQTPLVKKVIEYAIEEAKRLDHNYVGTEHLLLGLVRVEDGVASKVLAACGVTAERVRFEVEWLLGVRREEKTREAAAELAMPLSRNLLIYVAGPISKGDVVENVKKAHEAGMRLMKAGFSVIVPHGSCFFGNDVFDGRFKPAAAVGDFTHADWLSVDKEIVRRCDAVVRLPGESTGADMEVLEALKHGIPAYHGVEELFAAVLQLPVDGDNYFRRPWVKEGPPVGGPASRWRFTVEVEQQPETAS